MKIIKYIISIHNFPIYGERQSAALHSSQLGQLCIFLSQILFILNKYFYQIFMTLFINDTTAPKALLATSFCFSVVSSLLSTEFFWFSGIPESSWLVIATVFGCDWGTVNSDLLTWLLSRTLSNVAPLRVSEPKTKSASSDRPKCAFHLFLKRFA